MIYGETVVGRVVHIVNYTPPFTLLCDPENYSVGISVVYTIGTYPYIATYCSTCVGKLLEATVK